MSTNGTALSANQALQIADLDLPVTVWTDPDAAGQNAATRAHEMLIQAGITDPRHVTTHLTDPSDYHHKFGPTAVTEALAKARPLLLAVIDQQLDQIKDQGLHRTIEAVRGLGPTLAKLPYQQQGEIAQHIATRTRLQATTIATALTEGTPHPGRPQGAATAPTPMSAQVMRAASVTQVGRIP